ncbi:MAG TPA: MOSC domain-containing protein [Pseudomonas sp.]|nr:MOSC domain-containing protein [Pseudomonas sp.]
MQWPVEGPFLGDQLLRLPGTEKPSAIDKQLARDAVWLDIDGLGGNRVADRRFHGGPIRSVCHYPAEHYARWRRLYPHLQLGPAAFGENISSRGIDEHQVCIGDRCRWGAALIEVSQPRSPCVNLDRRHDARGLARQLARSGLTGWLYRTLEPGEIGIGSALHLIERPYPAVSVAHLWHSFVDDATDNSELIRLAELPPLAMEYRKRFRQRLDSRRRQRDQRSLF